MGGDDQNYDKTLTDKEAVWVEQRIDAALKSKDRTEFKPIVGSNSKNVRITYTDKLPYERSGICLNVFRDLMNVLYTMTEYGSV